MRFGRPERRFHRRVRLDDLILFARQLTTLLEAGVPLLRSLGLILEQIESRQLYLAVKEVRGDIEGGRSLRDALNRHPAIFSRFWISLVETGEASGQLPSILDQLARYLEAKGALRGKIISATVYPVLLISAAILAVAIFMLVIIPVFAGIFAGFDMPLPLMTRMVMALSDAARHYFIHGLIVLGGVGYGIYRYINTERGRWRLDQFQLNLPLVGTLLCRIAAARFARGLGTLVKSGTPILRALEMMTRTAGNKVVEKALGDVRIAVRDGRTMAEPLRRTGIFPPMVAQMVTVGEETGKLGEMLDRIADFYEERIARSVDRLTALFEPMMLVLLGGVIGFLVMAMFLPIFRLSSVIRG